MFDFNVDENDGQDEYFIPYLFSILNQQRYQRPTYSREQENYSYQQPKYQYPSPNYNENFGADGNDLMSDLRHRESGGNYGAVNKLGYSGAYQFGAPALEDLGYLRPGSSRHGNKALNNPMNWTIPGGKEAFLANRELQDTAMRRFMDLNRSKLQKMGLINANTSPQRINAMLAAAHLAGPGGVKSLLAGRNLRDAFGTGAQEYFNLGMRAR